MEIKAEKIDFKLCCRCCLKSDTEFYKLDTYMIDDLNDKKISLLECLTQCLRREDVLQLPKYICTGCSKTLHIAHKFMQTALEAHEILCRKLCAAVKQPDALRKKHVECYNGHRGETEAASGCAEINPKKEYLICDELEDINKPLHFRCKVCGEKLQTKNALKEHVRIHLDLISYSCEMCNYDTRILRKLKLHYRIFHGTDATQQQLNPKTIKTDLLMSPAANQLEKLPETRVCTLEDIELLIPSAITRQELTQHLEKDQSCADNQRRTMPRRQKLNNKTEQSADELHEVLQMATVISDPDNLGALTTNELPQFDAVLGNELSVGTEFVLKSDGSVEQVINNNVVIEYINVPPTEQLADDTTEFDVIATDIELVKEETEYQPMDVEDIIVEDIITPEKNTNPPTPIRTSIAQGKHIEKASTTSKSSRKKCIVCGKILASMNRLRAHLMSHKNLPKYFCDQCNFYTLVSSDMSRHYHNYHNDGNSGSKSETFSCDMCLFETRKRENLRFHYQATHHVKPTEVQLRPNLPTKNESNSKPKPMPDYPTGLTCAMCPSVFYFRWKYKEHLKEHVLAGQAPKGIRPDIPSANKDELDIINAAQAFVCTSSSTTTTNTPTCIAKTQYDLLATTATPSLHVIPTHNLADNAPTTMLDTVAAAPTSTTAAEPIIGEMQDFIDSTDVAAVCTIPADAIQVVESDDIVIDNNMNFNFNADQLFDDFGDEDDDGDDDDDDENDNNDSAIDQNLLLTSDDDDFDDFDDEQSKYLQKPFCMYCNKKFTSQYIFENHMFLHRGLAPYRCEMCTNLYNTKRALLRHYKAVHKRMPSRDMVQAKGDKVTVDRTPVETLNVDEHRPLTLMCGKCPFECLDRNEMRIHLGMHHHLDDDAFIISKLPFECPRCIRTYATKTSLVRHLQRSHLVATIIEQTSASTNSAAATKTTNSMPATSTTFLNNIAAMVTETAAAAAAAVEGATESAAGATSTVPLITTATCGATAQTSVNMSSCIVADTNHDDIAGITTAAAATNYDTIMTNGMSTLGPLFNCADYDFIEPNAAVMEHPIAEKKEFSYTYRNHIKSKILAASEAAEILAQTARDSHSHQCSICQCTYPTINLLKVHIKRHVATNFDCSYCGNSFVRRSELDKHLRIHEEEKSYKCMEAGCEKAFNYKHHLKRHQDVAHLLKRYHCPLTNCGKRLTSQSQLKKHIIGHRGGLPPYKCTICERSYGRRKLLRQHSLKAHNVELTDNEIAEIYRANVGYTNPVDMKFYKYNEDAKLLSLLKAVKDAHDAKFDASATTFDEATTLTAETGLSNAEIAKAVVHIIGDQVD